MLQRNVWQKIRNKVYLSLIGVFLLGMDQGLKWWVQSHQKGDSSFFSFFLNDRFILGYGPTFDLFIWLAILLILLLGIIAFKKNYYQNLAFIIMLSGAVSNVLDRILRGGVIDYFRLNFSKPLHFNLADVCLFLGLFYYLFLLGRENEKNADKISRHK